MANVIDLAVQFALDIARNPKHGYSQINRWGPDYDCSSLVIAAFQGAGVPVRDMGATYTGNMYNVFIAAGFQNVTNSVALSSGKGLRKGDILLNSARHTAIALGNGQLVHASIDENGTIYGKKQGDQTGKEICERSYYNYPWNYVLRWPEAGANIPVSDVGDLAVDGVRGVMVITRWQSVMGTVTDGFISKPVSQLIKADQTFLNSQGAKLKVDGEEGPLTIKARQKYLGVKEDGVLGPITNRAHQSALNKAKVNSKKY